MRKITLFILLLGLIACKKSPLPEPLPKPGPIVGFSPPPSCSNVCDNIGKELSGELYPGQIIYHPKYWMVTKVTDPATNVIDPSFTSDAIFMGRKYYFHSNPAWGKSDLSAFIVNATGINDTLFVCDGHFVRDCGHIVYFEDPVFGGDTDHYIVSHSKTNFIWDFHYGDGSIRRFYLKYHLEGLF